MVVYCWNECHQSGLRFHRNRWWRTTTNGNSSKRWNLTSKKTALSVSHSYSTGRHNNSTVNLYEVRQHITLDSFRYSSMKHCHIFSARYALLQCLVNISTLLELRTEHYSFSVFSRFSFKSFVSQPNVILMFSPWSAVPNRQILSFLFRGKDKWSYIASWLFSSLFPILCK